MNKRRIPDGLYKKILRLMPIPTVDLVVIRGKGKNREFLLGKRANNPYRGRWFVPGGRILWGETLTQAVRRNLRQELGLRPVRIKFVSHFTFHNPPGNLGVKYYTLCHVHLVEVKPSAKPRHDAENSGLAWFKKIDRRWPLPTREMLRLGGIR